MTMLRTVRLILGRSEIVVQQIERQIRAATHDEPSDWSVGQRTLSVNGRPANPRKYHKLVDRVMDRGTHTVEVL